ncbi:SMI1/KNR4 family protein [Glycomyces sp. YM15]|uniref:SMI1/KNR4 family protein n=1 Tax=Glycomyces sp. YM15 TaxID=2800446 RepID=UPI001964605C|nr:SMI1/KNR4 family protein [Glycomyces sp. YM15]
MDPTILVSDWPARIYPITRALVALASLDLTGHLQAGAPRPRATPPAIAAFEYTTGCRLDAGHRRFLTYMNGWPVLWPVNLFGLPELSDRHRMTRMTNELAATGDLAPAGLEPADVYPVAWAREGGTAVIVRPGRPRAGEVMWCEGVTTTVYNSFTVFFDAAAARLLTITGPLAGGTEADDEDERLPLGLIRCGDADQALVACTGDPPDRGAFRDVEPCRDFLLRRETARGRTQIPSGNSVQDGVGRARRSVDGRRFGPVLRNDVTDAGSGDARERYRPQVRGTDRAVVTRGHGDVPGSVDARGLLPRRGDGHRRTVAHDRGDPEVSRKVDPGGRGDDVASDWLGGRFEVWHGHTIPV